MKFKVGDAIVHNLRGEEGHVIAVDTDHVRLPYKVKLSECSGLWCEVKLSECSGLWCEEKDIEAVREITKFKEGMKVRVRDVPYPSEKDRCNFVSDMRVMVGNIETVEKVWPDKGNNGRVMLENCLYAWHPSWLEIVEEKKDIIITPPFEVGMKVEYKGESRIYEITNVTAMCERGHCSFYLMLDGQYKVPPDKLDRLVIVEQKPFVGEITNCRCTPEPGDRVDRKGLHFNVDSRKWLDYVWKDNPSVAEEKAALRKRLLGL